MLASGSEVLEAIARARITLLHAGFRFHGRPEVREIHCDLTLTPSENAYSIPFNLYLDVGLIHGPGLVWDIDASWWDRWKIASEFRFVYGEDDEVVRAFAGRHAGSPDGFVAELARAVEDLIESIGEVDLAKYLDRYPAEGGIARETTASS